MTITIKNIDDIEKFKKYVSANPTQPLCYVFFKENLRFPNVHYVGVTSQYGINKYKYLNNHHRMGNLTLNLKNGYSIQIYLKYDECGLITLLKPTLNKQYGTIMGGRHIRLVEYSENKLRNIGEIIGKKYEHLFIKKPTCIKYSDEENIWEEIFNKEKKYTYNFKINRQFYTQLILENINKQISNNDREIINDSLFKVVNDEYIKRQIVNKFNNDE